MRRTLLAFVLLLSSLSLRANETNPPPSIENLAGDTVSPLSFTSDTRGVILFFVAPDCPISNRYAPTIARIAQDSRARGFKSWLIYADDLADVPTIKTHQQEFSLNLPTALDRKYLLTKYTGADVTPEAVVYIPPTSPTTTPRLAYRGRIDDQYEGFGRYRPVATHSELTTVLEQIINGTPPKSPIVTKAIGCYIPQ
jgi:hypothetical protein